MTPPKKKATTSKAKGTSTDKILVIETALIPVKNLKTHHKNPRQGDVDLIAESLETNGQFRPILVNIGTKTKRPYEIAAGNHTYLAARRLGWDEILASKIDVDEKTLTKIVLADNRTADAGTYDDEALAELFRTLDDVAGTGYNAHEVDEIIANVDDMIKDSASIIAAQDFRDSMPEPTQEESSPRRAQVEESEEQQEADFARGATRARDVEDDEIDDIETVPGQKSQAELQAELQGILELREENLYMGKNFWQIPDLREDMLVMDLPKNIQTWAGWEATPDDGKKTFFYNYGLGGTKGLPLDRTILAFNTHDDKFINFWEQPAYVASKLIAGGLRMAVAPDFSFYYTMPRFVHLQGVYRSQWIARFLQEAGVRIIPRVQFDDEKSFEFNMTGIPKNPPYIELSVQNTRDDMGKKEDSEKHQAKLVQMAVDALEPTRGVIIYGGNPGRRVLDMLKTRGAEKIWIENYAAVRRGTVFDKKDGIAALSAADKKKLRKKAREEEAARMGVSPEEIGKKHIVPLSEDEMADQDQ